jgi:BMFP domain-containing protein YqiC
MHPPRGARSHSQMIADLHLKLIDLETRLAALESRLAALFPKPQEGK